MRNDRRISISGDVHLNLADGSTAVITKGIHCDEIVNHCILTITGTGSLNTTTPDQSHAGIGGNLEQRAGTINIEGGIIVVEGGNYGAGIGAGSNAPSAGNINISGGTVTATGGGYAAGIGGSQEGSGGIITISGGEISATGGYGAAGIGGGSGGDGGIINISGGTILSAQGGEEGAGIGGGAEDNGGTITISGNARIVSAVGRDGGAGIGGGYLDYGGAITISGNARIESAVGSAGGAGIGGGNGHWENDGSGGIITISGNARIESAIGASGGAGIGGGYEGNGGQITIFGGEISATGVEGGAGIGAGYNGDGGTVNIEGGTISAHGGENAAGIGGGDGNERHGVYDGTVTISGGDISATGGDYAAGIGGGAYGDGGTINISGGTIQSAHGGYEAAGIGGGYRGDGGTIKIEGGTIAEATGGDAAAGIGGGLGGDSITTIEISGGEISANGGQRGAGIGGGLNSNSVIIEISGGTISAQGGGAGGAGIGGGASGTGSTTVITGGSIKATSTATAIFPDPTNDNLDPVYLNTLTADGFDESLVTAYYNPDYEYGINDVYTDEESKLYFYLPATGEDAELLAVSFYQNEGNKPYYGLDYHRADDVENEENLEFLQLATPSATIDNTNKKLTGLVENAYYDISIHTQQLGSLSLSLEPQSLTQQNGQIIQANGDGEIPFDESWEGYSIDVIQSYTIPYSDSEAQVLDIPGTPAVPTDSNSPAELDLTATGLNLDLAYLLLALLLFATFLKKQDPTKNLIKVIIK
jgi:hypothetical protein